MSIIKTLPYISKWNLNNLQIIDNIFEGCSSLISFPDISKCNFFNKPNKNNLNNLIKESLSSKNSSNIEDINFSENINWSMKKIQI